MAGIDSEIVERARRIAERVTVSEALELVEVEWRGDSRRGVLRIFIDKPGGVTIADCANVSRQTSTILDVEDAIAGASYTLEVSSPGLDRKLRKASDYERFAERKAKLKLRRPVEGRKHVTGRLKGVEDGRVVIETARGAALRVELENVAEARLVVEFRRPEH